MFRGDRLEELLEKRGISQSELARRVGVSQTSIWKLTKEAKQGSKHLHKIARELGTTPEYLTGETDNPEPAGVGDARLAFKGFEPPVPLGKPSDTVAVREIDLTFGFGATYLDVPVTETIRHFSRDFIRHYTKARPEDLVFAQGVGDSMFPTLMDSDLLLIDCSQQVLNVSDKIWAVAYAECGSVKRLRPVPGGGVEMLADNPAVPNATAYDGELHILGRVVAVVRKM